MGNKPKVIIAVACQNTVFAKMACSVIHMCKGLMIDFDFIMRLGCDIVGSRIWLVKRAKELGGTHILFVDDDMSFLTNKENPLKTLLERDKDIIGAAYNFRSLPFKSTAVDAEGIRKDEPYKCKTLGTGFLLIKLDVFDKLPEPWFTFGRKPDGDLAYGEDTYFCQQAIKAGFDVWCDPTLSVQHIGEYLF